MRILTAALTALLLTTAPAAVAPTVSADSGADSCLGRPFIYNLRPLTGDDMYLTVAVDIGYDRPCDGITVQLRKADGTHPMTVELGGRIANPPQYLRIGWFLMPVYDGAGTWVITRLSQGTESVATNVQFKMLHGSYTSLDEPTPVVSPRHTLLTGWVWDYTRVGGLVPSAGRTVRIMNQDDTAVLATTRTDSAGRFRVGLAVWRRTTLSARAVPLTWYAGSDSTKVTTSVRIGVQRVTAPSAVRLGSWWTLTGQAFPGRLSTSLDYWNGKAWVWTGSTGVTGTDGWFKRGWKPTRTGTFRLRLVVAANPAIGLLGNPAVRSFSITVVR
jgi:hypothetical protein